ncbi:MAG: tRNA pseudouridine(38-40) synthase TruA, partial [Bacteroidales bacterium]|nr:tRNA pseudouridine(38-40) synthase TruA [Bacteroidales bacterium]
MRYKIELAYNGRNYHGWQIQPNAITVQERLNKCLSLMLKAEIETLGCGRTDTGVHASHFVAHFDYTGNKEDDITKVAFLQKINKFLPPDIVIFGIEQAPDEFNARFDAKSRTYKYLIHTRKDPFINESSWFFPYKLDVDLMNQGAKILMEYSDFASFCKAGADNGTTICKLMEC